MTFITTCWKPQLAALAIVASLLAGCGTVGSDRPVVAACPPVVRYGAEIEARAADEMQALSEGAAIETVLSDYAVMRDQSRACGTTDRPSSNR